MFLAIFSLSTVKFPGSFLAELLSAHSTQCTIPSGMLSIHCVLLFIFLLHISMAYEC